MLLQHSLLDYIFLTESVVDIWEFITSWELIIWIQRMSLSFCLWTFFQWVRLSSNNIIFFIGHSISSSLPSMKVSKTFSSDFTTMNIHSLQWFIHESLVLPSWRKDIWCTTCNRTDRNFLIIFISCCVFWLQWIYMPCGFKIGVSYISIIHLIKYILGSSSSWTRSMSLPRLSTFYILNIHYLSCWKVKLLLFQWTSSWNIINTHLISDKL